MKIRRGETPLVQDYLHKTAARLPDKIALVAGAHRLTYREIEERSNALANFLLARGVRRGDMVVVFADNTIETAISFWAIHKAGAVVSIVNSLTKKDRFNYLIKDCRPAALIAELHLHSIFSRAIQESTSVKTVILAGGTDEAVREGLPGAIYWQEALSSGDCKQSPENGSIDMDLGAIIYTSGSTGDPKGVMLTHRNMIAACESISSYLEIREDEVILGVLSLAYSYGLYQMIMAFRAGARVILERSFAFPAQILKVMVDEGVTGFPAVPTIFSVLAEFKSLGEYDLSRIRYITNAAAALPLKHVQFLRKEFPSSQIFSMYGMTECNRCSYLPPEDIDRKPASIGIAIPNMEFWIVDEEDNRVGPGVTGQLVIRSSLVMRGYWEKPEATARKLRPGIIPGEQVLYTGDYCRMDEEGYLYYVSRMDDIIKSGGEKVAPKEVEHALMNVEGVREAAVIGIPDEMLGQAIKAFVVFEEGITIPERQLRMECQRVLENIKVPRHIVAVSALPRTDTGKIKKTGLV